MEGGIWHLFRRCKTRRQLASRSLLLVCFLLSLLHASTAFIQYRLPYGFVIPSPSPSSRRCRGGRRQGVRAGLEEYSVVLRVKASASHAILPAFLSTHGRLLRSSDSKPMQAVPPNTDVAFHLVAGSSRGEGGEVGQEVVAFVDPSSVTRVNADITVPSSCVFQRPPSLSAEQACVLPYYALDLLPPLIKAGVHSLGGGGDDADKNALPSGSNKGRKVGVVTGAGPQAAFAIQVLRSWGFRVVGCSRRSFDELKRWGADDVVDFSQESFSEKHGQGGALAVVVDTVGMDVDGLASNLQRMTGAAYVSTMPSSTRRMQAQGLLQGASLFTSMFVGKQPDAPPTLAYWLPEKQGREIVQYALNAADAGMLKVPTKGPGMDDYLDGILWPKDADSDFRFGFPASSLASAEGGGLSDVDLLRKYTQASMLEGGELNVIMSKYRTSFQRMSSSSPAAAAASTGSGGGDDWRVPTVLFVTAPNCKVCIFTKPKVSQLAEEFTGVQFFNLVADPERYMVAEMLEVPSYPFFIVYAGGERVSTHKALGPELVKQIFSIARLGGGGSKSSR